MADNEEHQLLIATNPNIIESTSNDYGGISSNYLSTKTKQIKNHNDEDKYQNATIFQFDNTNKLNNNNILAPNLPLIENSNSLMFSEPRSRTTSERFHCHNGNLKQSDDNISGIAGSDSHQKTNTNSNQKAIRVLWLSVFICLIFMICEVIGGIWAQSLAIITDAAHLLTDLASMLISLFSLYLASRPASQRMSFGWYRAEVVGAFISVFLIWVVTGILVYLAIDRIITQTYDINGKVMAITAGIGVSVNIIMSGLLYFGGHGHTHLGIGKHSHSYSHSPNGTVDRSISTASLKSLSNKDREALLNDLHSKNVANTHKQQTNINVRAAFIHVLGDLIQSVGVLIAALLILWKGTLGIMDPICTLIFSIIVVSTTVYIIRDALVVLLEGRPSNINFSHVFNALEQIDGVRKVHDLRIWALTIDKVAISVHLEISSEAHAQTVLKNTTYMLRRQFNVHESTVQIEGWRPDSVNCNQCVVPTR